MGFVEVQFRAKRYDSGGIDRVVARVVVMLYVIDIAGWADFRVLVDVFDVIPQVGEIGERTQVALEMAVVDGVEADESGEQGDVGFGEVVSAKIASFAEKFVVFCQGIKKLGDGFIVGALLGGEACAVYAVVDWLVDIIENLFDVFELRIGCKVDFVFCERVELLVEHAHDLA